MKRFVSKVLTLSLIFVVTLISGCSKKDNVSGGDNIASEKITSNTSETVVRAGTPAPATDFNVSLSSDGYGVKIEKYNGNAKSLTIPVTIEDMPVISITLRGNECEQLFIPEGVKIIYISYFKNLRAISIPNSVENIGISDCPLLSSVSIPENVTNISSFRRTGIKSIKIPASVKHINEDEAFYESNNLVKAEFYGPDRIPGTAFRGCSALQTVIIHEGVKEIGADAFSKCNQIINLTLPSSLERIYERAFSNCSSLVSLEIPNGVITIGSNAFANCTNLVSVKIPKSVKIIYGNAFAYCLNLVDVEIEEGASIYYDGEIFYNSEKLNLKSQVAIRAAMTRDYPF
jgi:hypothetical protein